MEGHYEDDGAVPQHIDPVLYVVSDEWGHCVSEIGIGQIEQGLEAHYGSDGHENEEELAPLTIFIQEHRPHVPMQDQSTRKKHYRNHSKVTASYETSYLVKLFLGVELQGDYNHSA